ncbi:MAG: hypothetical protein JWN38_1275 [Candidatus Saccharibacteria bacterium]|nr:hypothetical protein [Candidatus Saccharibacteria bacterium]
MSEFYFQAPTPEETSAAYKDMTFQDFKQLDDEAVEALRVQERDEWFAACAAHSLFESEWQAALKKSNTFSRFMEWRRFGVPDRDMTDEEFLARMKHYIDVRRDADHTYGELSPADTEHLTPAERQVTLFAMEDASNSYSAQPDIDVSSSVRIAGERLGVTYDDLVKKGVLAPYEMPSNVVFKGSTGYVLAGKFATHVLVTSFGEE